MIALLLLLFHIFGTVMRKWLRVEKKKRFSHNHVNDQHSKIDWSIRIVFMVIIFVGTFINATRDPVEKIWFLEPWYLLFGLIFLSESVRVFMEWKYAENKNAFIFTLSQLVFSMIVVITSLSTNFFGMF